MVLVLNALKILNRVGVDSVEGLPQLVVEGFNKVGKTRVYLTLNIEVLARRIFFKFLFKRSGSSFTCLMSLEQAFLERRSLHS
jgi:hypothetical protein